MCHDAGVPLIVDEAHGAPLAFLRGRGGAPAAALAAGADVAVQSSHKTLSALGQARSSQSATPYSCALFSAHTARLCNVETGACIFGRPGSPEGQAQQHGVIAFDPLPSA